MIAEYTFNAEDVRAMMLNTMERHLSLKMEGYCSTTNETFNLLLKAVAEGSSVEAAAWRQSARIAAVWQIATRCVSR